MRSKKTKEILGVDENGKSFSRIIRRSFLHYLAPNKYSIRSIIDSNETTTTDKKYLLRMLLVTPTTQGILVRAELSQNIPIKIKCDRTGEQLKFEVYRPGPASNTILALCKHQITQKQFFAIHP